MRYKNNGRRANRMVLLSVLLSLSPGLIAQPAALVANVDPFIGTSVSDVPTRWGNEGGCYPGAVALSGNIQLTPETRHAATTGYDYRDSGIFVFSCLHHNSGFPGGSAGRLYIMPVRPDSGFNLFQSERPFLHSGESAVPGYYRVRLTDDGTQIEATAGTRTGLFRLRFPAGVRPRVFIGDTGNAGMSNDSSISGGRFNLIISFSLQIVKSETVPGGMILNFEPDAGGITELLIRLSASTVSVENAAANLATEAPRRDGFDSVKLRTSAAWEEALSVAAVSDPDTVAKKIFYTALYHSLLVPWVASDVNGEYRGEDGQVHQKSGTDEYGNFSPWDTYRTLHPLRAFLFPGMEHDIALSIFDIWLQTGRLPVESMTGNHAIAILADDYAKGLLPVDKKKLFAALQSNLTDSPFVQRDMRAYLRDGFLSSDWPESVTRTVEYGYDDWVLEEYARIVMHDSEAAEKFARRSQGYRKLFDPDAQLILPKAEDGFMTHAGTTGYKESDAWVYSFSIPQDVKGLSNMMGSDESFVRRLDSALEDGRIYFDNETVFHVPWIFNEAGAPQATQYWNDRFRRQRYHATQGGVPGNDDLGSASSWYVWSALGFYPLTPGRPLYAIASPLFREITLHLAGGKTLRISRDGPGYRVKDIRVKDKPFHSLVVSHSQLMNGGDWRFRMRSDSLSRKSRVTPDKIPNGDKHVFSETGSGPAFRVSRPILSQTIVAPDEPFRIRFTAVNAGAAGTLTLNALDGDELLGTRSVLVDSTRPITAEIICRAYRPGKRIIWIGQQRLLLTVIKRSKPPGPGYRISDLRARPVVRLGEEQVFSFHIRNTGSALRRFVVPVTLNKKWIDSLPVRLKPGEMRWLTGKILISEAGQKLLCAGGEQLRFRVFHSATESVLLDLKWFPGASDATDSGMRDRSGFANDGRLVTMGNAEAMTLPDGDGVPVGAGNRVAISSAPSLDLMDSSMTMMAWILPGKNPPGLADIFTKGDHHVLQLAGTDQLSFFAGGWGRGDCTIRVPADWVGHWHHIAGVCRGRRLTLYLDGREAGSTVTDEPVNLSIENHWNLGCNEEFPGIRTFKGRLNYVRVYADALSPEEINSEMNREVPRL